MQSHKGTYCIQNSVATQSVREMQLPAICWSSVTNIIPLKAEIVLEAAESTLASMPKPCGSRMKMIRGSLNGHGSQVLCQAS